MFNNIACEAEKEVFYRIELDENQLIGKKQMFTKVKQYLPADVCEKIAKHLLEEADFINQRKGDIKSVKKRLF